MGPGRGPSLAGATLLVLALAAGVRADGTADVTSFATPFGQVLARARADGTLARIEGEHYLRQPAGVLKVLAIEVRLVADVVALRLTMMRADGAARAEEYDFDRDGRLSHLQVRMGDARHVMEMIDAQREGEVLRVHAQGAREHSTVTRPCPGDAVPLMALLFLLPMLSEDVPAGAGFRTLVGVDVLEGLSTLAPPEATDVRPVPGSPGARCVIVVHPNPGEPHVRVPVWITTEGEGRGTIEGLVYGTYLERISTEEGRGLLAPPLTPAGPPAPGGGGQGR